MEYQQLKALCNMENRSRQQGQISGGRRTTSRNSNHNTNLNANHACVEELSKTKSAMEGQLFNSSLLKHLLPARLSTTMLLRWLWNNLTSQPAIVTLQEKKGIIASQLNLTHEHFSRILRGLATAAMVEVDGRIVRIRDVDRLRAYCLEA